jgi:hypothetical protein
VTANPSIERMSKRLLGKLSDAAHLHRYASALSLLALTALSACVGLEQSRELPTASAQTAAEVGKLPVGRVMTVERKYAAAGRVNPVAGPVADLFTNTDWYFRHRIRLLDGTVVERDEYAPYNVGACVALRPHLLVPAYEGQCG